MKKLVHKSSTRGGGEHGWLTTAHSFSFADWYEPTRMGFGALRVLNDDQIAPNKGFGKHSHDNFEIITVVLRGTITHKDSMGNEKEVREGEVQVMSAGTGVTHSEFNNHSEPLELFQIWIEPNTHNVLPRYDQKEFDTRERKNKWQVVVSDGSVEGSLMIHQNAQIALANVEEGKELQWKIGEGNGVYVMVIEGEVEAAGERLARRDAVGISETDSISISANKNSSLLLIEVPMR